MFNGVKKKGAAASVLMLLCSLGVSSCAADGGESQDEPTGVSTSKGSDDGTNDLEPGSQPADPRDVEGVTMGWPRSETGAIAAIGNLGAALYSQEGRDPERQEQLLKALSVDGDTANRLTDVFASADSDLKRALYVDDLTLPYVRASAQPYGYSVYEASKKSVTADVLFVGAVGMQNATDGERAVREFTETVRMTVRWVEDDWRLYDWVKREDGPALDEASVGAFTAFPIGVTS